MGDKRHSQDLFGPYVLIGYALMTPLARSYLDCCCTVSFEAWAWSLTSAAAD